MSTWTNIRDKLIGVAPALAASVASGNPLPAIAAISQALLGHDKGTPDEVAAAVAGATPDQLLALRKADYDFYIAQGAQDIEEAKAINETMQAESRSEHWPQWAWRPFIGFTFGAAFLFVAILVCWLAYQAVVGGKPEALNMIPQLVTSMTMLFGVPGGILGVAAYHRGRMQVELAKSGKD